MYSSWRPSCWHLVVAKWPYNSSLEPKNTVVAKRSRMRLKCYCHWETKCINDIDIYHISTIIFLRAGLQNKGVMISMTPGGCRVSPSRIRRTLTSHLPGGDVATGFFGWLMLWEDRGRFFVWLQNWQCRWNTGFRVWKAPGFKEMWVPAQWQGNPYHYHHTLSQPILDLQYLTYLLHPFTLIQT